MFACFDVYEHLHKVAVLKIMRNESAGIMWTIRESLHVCIVMVHARFFSLNDKLIILVLLLKHFFLLCKIMGSAEAEKRA